jgi:hypothetical protein
VASKPKTQTLGEFRSWLEGVEEMQAENWAPDLTQWRRIREKIDNIVEAPRSFKSGAAGASDTDEQPARVIRPSGPSAFSGATMPQPIAATPPPFMNTSDVAGARISTPNVDTSKQPYSSSLE